MDLWVSDLAPGDRVHVAMTKWGGARHWTFDAKWLGSDEHGHWMGQHLGDELSRPGRRLRDAQQRRSAVPTR